PAVIDSGHSITGISCTATVCVAVDDAGRALVADVTDLATWTPQTIDGSLALTGVSCSSDGELCVAIDGSGNVVTAPDPTGTWMVRNVDGTTPLTGVSCGSSTLCVAVDNVGQAVVSADPTTTASWTVTKIDPGTGLAAVSCTTEELCVATDTMGTVLVSQDPTGGLSSWTGSVVDGAPPVAIGAISCVGGLCVGGDSSGNAVTSNSPVAGSWQVAPTPLGAIAGVSCPTQGFCVAVDSSGKVLTASAPPSTGFAGAIAFNGFATLTSRGGSDTLIGSTADSTTWTIADLTTGAGSVVGTSAGTSTTEIAFSGIQTLIGGLGDPGDNAIAYASPGDWAVTGENRGSLAPSGGSPTISFIGFDRLAASGLGADTLAGPSTGADWTLIPSGTSLPDGTTLPSSGFLVDDVTVTGVNSIAAGGTNVDTLTGPPGGSTWTVDSSGGVTLVTTGGAYAFTGIANLVSGPDGDTLVAPAGGTGVTWTIDGNGSGTLDLSGASLSFARFATLTGGGSDTLNAPGWADAGSGSGTVAGASFSGMGTIASAPVGTFTYEGAPGGSDAITIRTHSGPNGIQMEIDGSFGTTLFSDPTGEIDIVLGGDDNTVTLQSLDAGVPAVVFDGGDGTGQTLVGRTVATEFTTDGAGSGTIAGASNTYSNFTSLQGQSGGDSLVGPSDGADDPVAWTLTAAGTGTLGTVSFSGFATLVGQSGVDTLAGPADATWTVTGTSTGTVDGTAFTGFSTLVGGTGTQTLEGPSGGGQFTIDGNDSVKIDGIEAWGLTALVGEGPNDTLFEPCGVLSTGSGTCGAIAYSGMETVTSQAPSTYTYRGSSGGDAITVAAAAGRPGYLAIVDNNAAATFAADPTGKLVILGGGGTDTITLYALDSAFDASLEIYGTRVLDLAPKTDPLSHLGITDTFFAGEALFGANGLSVEVAGAVNLGGGDLTALVQHFTVDDAASLTTTGRILVWAEDIQTTPETVVLVQDRSATISIGDNATVSGGSVSLIANSWDGGSLAQQLAATGGVAGGIGSGALSLLAVFFGNAPINVIVKSADVSVTVGQGATVSATTGSLQLMANASVASSGSPNSAFFTVGYSQATATATVDVQSDAHLSAAGAVDVLANGVAGAKMEAETERELKNSPPDPLQTAAAIAITYAHLTVSATLEAGATITAGTTVSFNATGNADSESEAKSSNKNNGAVGIAIGLEFSNANVTTNVAGDISATAGPGSNMVLTFDPDQTDPNQIGYVDVNTTTGHPATHTIYVGPNSFQTGDPVTYSNGGGVSVGGPFQGLVNGETYYVIRLAGDPNRIQLAATLQDALMRNPYRFGDAILRDFGTYLGVQVGANIPNSDKQSSTITKSFDGSAIDPDDNTITVSLGRATGSDLLTFNLFGTQLTYGQPVQYHQGSEAIQGLTDGQIYWVIVPLSQYDPAGTNALVAFSLTQQVQLATSYAAANAGNFIDFGCPCTGTGYSLTSVHVLQGPDQDMVDGIGINAILNAEDHATAEAEMADQEQKPEEPATTTFGKIKAKATEAKELATKATHATDTIFNLLSWKLATYLKSDQTKGKAPAKTSVAVGGAFAFSYGNHVDTVTIAPGADLESGNSTYTQAIIDEGPQLSASSSIEGTSFDAKKKKDADQHKTAVSLALSIADLANTATLTIGSNATLNAPDQTLIVSEVAYPLLAQLSSLPLSVGQLVGGLRSGAITLDAITGLKNPESGLMGIFGNGYANATAQAEKLAIAGSVTLLFYTNDSEEHIQSGVKINQGPFLNHNATEDNILTMFAENAEQLVMGAGQIKPAASAGVSVDPKGSSKSPGGAGGSFAGLVLNQTTLSIVAPDVAISTGAKGGTYVEVEELVMQIGLATSGAAADSTSVSGAVTLFDQTSNNLAQIDTGAHITGGPVEVFSESFESVIGGAGDVTTGHGVGIGVSVLISLINRNTASVLGSADLNAPGNGGTDIAVDGGVTVEAENGGVFWGFAVAGTVVTKQPTQKKEEAGSGSGGGGGGGGESDPLDEDDPLDGVSLPLLFGEDPVSQDEGTGSTPPDKPQAKTGAAIAGAAAINFVTDHTLAYINDLGTIDPGADGAVDVSASQKTDVQGGAGALAFDKGAGSKTNVAFAGALSLNDVNDTTRALVVGATIPEGGDLSVEATRTGNVDVGTVGAAGATASGRSIGIAGSVSWQQITAVTEAIVEGVTATSMSGDGDVTASDTTSEIAIGGGLAYGGEIGVGA
ncbi:MAG: hypothetical protein ACRDLK_04845, partial [Gaiellaceae bacterium]